MTRSKWTDEEMRALDSIEERLIRAGHRQRGARLAAEEEMERRIDRREEHHLLAEEQVNR